jgi:hypothetical protein
MAAVEHTIVQEIADAYGNNDGGVAVLVTDPWTDKQVTRDLTVDEARALAKAIFLAVDAVTEDRHRDAGTTEEPQEPRGDTISPSAHRRAESVAKPPQIAAEAQQERYFRGGGPCRFAAGHSGWCAT